MQPQTTSEDDRDRIIDATYDCLSEPHTGPVPVAVILARAEVSTRAFYRHFASKDELFLEMLRLESLALIGRLDRIVDEVADPVGQLRAWLSEMLTLAYDPRLRLHMRVIDSEEVRAAKGYRWVRESMLTARERSLADILERGRRDGSFPLTDPPVDAVAISAVISRMMTAAPPTRSALFARTLNQVFDFALRALGADRAACQDR